MGLWVGVGRVIFHHMPHTELNNHVPYFSDYTKEAFPFQNNPKNLDPSYKMDLDL